MQRRKKGRVPATKTRRPSTGRQAKGKPRNRPQAGTEEAVTLSYRPRTPEDDAYIVQLTEEQLGTVHQQAFREPFPRDQFLRYIQSGAPTFLIERNGKRIGYYSYLIGPDAKMHIGAMVVEPNYQSDGIGTKVMQKLEEDAQRAGVQVMEVFVQNSNERSMAFTRKLGFQEVFRIDENTVCFQKRVPPLPGTPGMAPPGQPPVPPQPIGWFG
ncbi:GNAT family N-acetyltransferase [Alicyclobacillus cycloheptanicus]|jgi:ribosomal protein S18 acetylase RimI-like enzyme|uniref:Ribosomal protein S18 acetylase RimI-like enzyme n=1 Tax=Alicyclobacillus cycloheptanicus TaxID=1457 RepID=A0ABT9XIM5_9BACL|nr:GNAT family N-acetyltransferase [Alicyclobacillus cycloheptanicus]MDQ0189980.1 ribosomal protein S18 acetylase RimI-like enzyme [Alicyclobacillus cycloheptanicus]WDM00108.1 GNAT family N-acetyltransferase [Alicyclobacillus cycloheptanicus]